MLKPRSSLVAAWFFAFAAMFMSPFAFVLSSAGYHMLKRGNFTFTPRDGPAQIFSSTSHPGVFWGTSVGVSTVGGLLLVATAVSVFVAILTNRWSQPLAAVKSTFDFMKQFSMFATLAAASGGSAPSR
jgi:hypothetical protein